VQFTPVPHAAGRSQAGRRWAGAPLRECSPQPFNRAFYRAGWHGLGVGVFRL